MCEALGLSPKNIARTAKAAGYPDTNAYLLAVHGVRPLGRTGRTMVYTRDRIECTDP